jgi:hypothetical protein
VRPSSPPFGRDRASVRVVLLSLGHTTSPDGRLGQFQALRGPVVVLRYAGFVHSARTGHPQSLSLSQHTLSCPLAELPSQIVMSVPGKNPRYMCSCGCKRSLTRWTTRRHEKLRPSPCSLNPIASPSQVASHCSFSGGPRVFHHHTRQAEAVSHRQHILHLPLPCGC